MTKESNLSPVRHLAKASSFSPEEAIKAFRSSIRSETTRVPYACAARHFLCWLNLQGIQITAVDSAVVRRFADHDCSCPRYSAAQARDPYYVNRVRRFVRFLEDRGDIPVINDIADLGQHLRRYAEQLASLGYNRWSQRRLNSVAEHLGLWLQASRIGWHDVNASVVERFVHHDCGCAEGRKSGEITKTGLQKRRLGAVRFLAFLQESDTVSLSPLKPRQDPAAEAFGDWLRHHRGATERTVESYVFIAARFLPALGPDPSAYDVAILRQIVLDQPAGFSRAAVRKAATVLRCFLRFQASNGRCRFYELAQSGPAPIATEALQRIAELYKIENEIRGRPADERRAARQERSRPIIDALESWLREKLTLVSQKSKLAEAIRYALARWAGLGRFLDDGRVEIDSNVVERSIRPIALNRKNALFAGSDGGGEHWATIASLIETAKLNGVDPYAYLADVITRIVAGHPQNQIDELLPWAYAPTPLKAVA